MFAKKTGSGSGIELPLSQNQTPWMKLKTGSGTADPLAPSFKDALNEPAASPAFTESLRQVTPEEVRHLEELGARVRADVSASAPAAKGVAELAAEFNLSPEEAKALAAKLGEISESLADLSAPASTPVKVGAS